MGQPSRKQIIYEVVGLRGDVFDVADTFQAPILSVGLTTAGHSRRQREYVNLNHRQVIELAEALDGWLSKHPPLES